MVSLVSVLDKKTICTATGGVNKIEFINKLVAVKISRK